MISTTRWRHKFQIYIHKVTPLEYSNLVVFFPCKLLPQLLQKYIFSLMHHDCINMIERAAVLWCENYLHSTIEHEIKLLKGSNCGVSDYVRIYIPLLHYLFNNKAFYLNYTLLHSSLYGNSTCHKPANVLAKNVYHQPYFNRELSLWTAYAILTV